MYYMHVCSAFSADIYIDVDLPLTIRVAVDKRTKNPPFLYIFLNSLKHLQPKNVQLLLHEHGDNNTKVSCWVFFRFLSGFFFFVCFLGGAGGGGSCVGFFGGLFCCCFCP